MIRIVDAGPVALKPSVTRARPQPAASNGPASNGPASNGSSNAVRANRESYNAYQRELMRRRRAAARAAKLATEASFRLP